MSIFNYIQVQITELFNGFQGLRLGKTRLLQPVGIFYKGYVYDSHNVKLPVIVRYSTDTLINPIIKKPSLFLYGFGIRVFKDNSYIQESMLLDFNNKPKASSLSESGLIADAFFIKMLENPPPTDITDIDDQELFNHAYIKPKNLTQTLAFSNAVAFLRLVGAFPIVVKIDNLLKLLGFSTLSQNICDKSIAKLTVDLNNSQHNKLILHSANNKPIVFYLEKTPYNPDSSNSLDSNNMKFIHQLQTFDVLPSHKKGFRRICYLFSQYFLYTYRYLSNTFSEDIYEEIPYEYKRIHKISCK